MDREERIRKMKNLCDKSFFNGEMLIVGMSKAILKEILEDCLISQGWKDCIFNKYVEGIDNFIKDSKKGESNE